MAKANPEKSRLHRLMKPRFEYSTCYVDCQPKEQLICPLFMDLKELITLCLHGPPPKEHTLSVKTGGGER